MPRRCPHGGQCHGNTAVLDELLLEACIIFIIRDDFHVVKDIFHCRVIIHGFNGMFLYNIQGNTIFFHILAVHYRGGDIPFGSLIFYFENTVAAAFICAFYIVELDPVRVVFQMIDAESHIQVPFFRVCEIFKIRDNGVIAKSKIIHHFPQGCMLIRCRKCTVSGICVIPDIQAWNERQSVCWLSFQGSQYSFFRCHKVLLYSYPLRGRWIFVLDFC